MASGFQPSIPLRSDKRDGLYVLTKTFNENARQNVRMIVLTEKGEKLTDIDFGCGLRAYLFEPEGTNFDERITQEILDQLKAYAPYIKVVDIGVTLREQVAEILIKYVILTTNATIEDTIEVTA
jgi:phage baseplate assembly protein W